MGVGYLKPFQQGRVYFHCAKGGQVNPLKVITSVFRPKSSEEQKKGFHALRLSFICIAYHLCTTKVLCICLRGEGGQILGIYPPQKGLVPPLLYSEFVLCLFSDVGYTINGRVLNNWNRILLKLQQLQTMEVKLKLLIPSLYYRADVSLRYFCYHQTFHFVTVFRQ